MILVRSNWKIWPSISKSKGWYLLFTKIVASYCQLLTHLKLYKMWCTSSTILRFMDCLSQLQGTVELTYHQYTCLPHRILKLLPVLCKGCYEVPHSGKCSWVQNFTELPLRTPEEILNFCGARTCEDAKRYRCSASGNFRGFYFRGSWPICKNHKILHHAKISRYTVRSCMTIHVFLSRASIFSLFCCLLSFKKILVT